MEMKEEVSPLLFFAEIAIVELQKFLKGKSMMVEEEEEEEEEKNPFIREKKKKKRMLMEEGESSNGSNCNRPYKKMKIENPAPIGGIEAHARMQNSSRPVFVFEKKLTKTDTSKHHNRLLIRKESAYGSLLPTLGYRVEDEERVLGRGIDVLGLDQMGPPWNLHWKWWKEGDMQVLTRQWFQMLTANGLEAEKDYLKVFVFRYGENQEKICFAITSFRKEVKKEERIHKKEDREAAEEEEDCLPKKKRLGLAFTEEKTEEE